MLVLLTKGRQQGSCGSSKHPQEELRCVLILSVERMKKKHIIGVLSKERAFVKKNFGYI